MHHHHLPPPILLNKGSLSHSGAIAVKAAPVNNISRNNNNVSVIVQQHQHQRRRKKRPNYGNRTVEVCRGFNGFGFTISGQQPCRLSCIVSNSPADQAGLRAGDFLISVNGLNVSKLPHDSVVQLIGNSFGSIRMQIAENYYSDSSDEENASVMQHNSHLMPPTFHTSIMGGLARKPRHLHQKAKLNRSRNTRSRVATATITNTKLRDKELFEQTLYKQPQQFTTQLKRQQFNHNIALQQLVQGPLKHQQVATVATETLAATKTTTTTETTTVSSSTITQLRSLIEHLPIRTEDSLCTESLSTSTNITTTTSNVSNVSAMVCISNNILEYRVLVGYLGTIEMPKQISQSSKLQTVRSCIRKLRQEKRQPTTTLMIILPDCLRLCSANGTILATYASSRLNYVSSASETENRFFGLVTSSIHTTPIDDLNDHNVTDNVNNNNEEHNHKHNIDNNNDDKVDNDTDNMDSIKLSTNFTEHITISNSCHVFVIDTKLCEHRAHSLKAQQFHIECTKDPIYPDVCLEFPSNSEYVVNLIRSMYTMRILPPATNTASSCVTQQQLQLNPIAASALMFGGGIETIAHSPQPSNHSEISTTTSNSDSGIGFNNDCRNISDRIVLVNFPQEHAADVTTTTAAAATVPSMTASAITTKPGRQYSYNDGDVKSIARPLGIFQGLNLNSRTKSPSTGIMNGGDYKRLSVRVRSDSIPMPNGNGRKYNFINNFLTNSRSCGDVLDLLENDDDCNYQQQQHHHKQQKQQQQQLQLCASSMDDISIHTASIENDEQKLFLHPSCLAAQHQQSTLSQNILTTKIWPLTLTSSSPLPVPDKLSPQVYISNSGLQLNKTPKKILKDSNSALSSNINSIQLITQDKALKIGGWTSLQNIPEKELVNEKMIVNLDQAISENNLMGGNITKTATNGSVNDVNGDADGATFASPTRRTWWSQISLRTPRSDKRTIYLNRTNRANNNKNNTNKICLRGNSQALQRSVSMGIETFDKEILKGNHMKQQNAIAVGNATHKQHNNININNWSISLECVLYSEDGLKTFAEFLKVEYSVENIYFWTACEHYKYLKKDTERRIKAQEIFDRHLSSTALEPVNIDAEARTAIEEKLKCSTLHPDLFEAAQKQIFNLMKYDSYQRFLRSDLYKKCQQALENNEALPYSTKPLDHMLRIKFQMDYETEKLEENPETHGKHDDEDRRRKSLLPWHRKVRRKSGSTHNKPSEVLRGVGSAGAGTIITSLNKKIQIGKQKQQQQQNADVLADIHSSRSSLSSYDSTINSHAVNMNVFDSKTPSSSSSSLCRVKLPNESTTIVQIQCFETVKELVDRVLGKRGLHYQYYEVYIKGLTTNKLINLQCSSQELIGKDLQIEYRVAFKLDLIDLAKVISVKSKPHKQLHQVIKPILQKYHYKIDQVELIFTETQEIIDLQQPVTVADGERLQVKLRDEKFLIEHQSGDNHDHIPDHDHNHNDDINGQEQQVQEQQQQDILSEIPNKVFQNSVNDKLDKTEDQWSMEEKNEVSTAADLTILSYSSLKPEERDCKSNSSTLLQQICNKRGDSSNLLDSPIQQSQNKLSEIKSNNVTTTTTSSATAATPIKQNTIFTQNNRNLSINQHDMAKSPINKQNGHTNENHDDLLEDLKRAQLARLEDQRGTEINIELPDFLKSHENISNNLSDTTSSDVLHRPQPAPRLSIAQKGKNPSDHILNAANTSINTVGISSTKSIGNHLMDENCKAGSISKSPPPLPPKPKILPIKPSNWGVHNNNMAINNELCRKIPSMALTAWPLSGPCLKILSQMDNSIITNNNNSNNNNINNNNTTNNTNNNNAMRGAYLQETSSSFV